MNFELGCLASDLGFPGLLRALEKSDVGMIPATKSLELRMANAKITICHRRGALSRFSSSGNHDMNITRRDFLTASAGFAAVPLLGARGVAAPLPREADIVVIGAGAAGIAAARRVIAANRKVIVIEAAGEIGGRCLTDTTTFDVPLDRGARWLHNPDANPLVKLARALALEMVVAPVGQKIRIGRRNARPGETEEFLAALVRTNRAIEEASRGKLDMACGSVIPKDLGDWAATAEFVLGANASGKDLKELSVIDKVRGGDRGALIACRLGLGTMVAKLADQIPVALSTPANRVEWSNRDVTVQTPAGKIAARAAVVTVSTNVLASGAIRFDPDLPKRKLDAASKLSLGSFDHITLQLSGNPLGLARDDAIIEQSSSTKTALLLANIGGSSVCSVDVGGSFGRDLSSQGEKAMVAFAVEWLTKLFGSEVGAAVKKSAATRWNAVPFVLGAMSAASPGGEPSRAALAEPMGAVFLAGEATHETLWGTVDGAWESGERAADAALRKIGALKDTTPAAPVPPGRSHRRSTSSRSARY
jgi:monoamine oxidase